MDILTITAIIITVHACGGLGFAWVLWESGIDGMPWTYSVGG